MRSQDKLRYSGVLLEVLVHNALMPRNVLISNSDPSAVHAFVNFGAVGMGNPLNDIAQIISTSATENALSIEQEYLHLYYDTLRDLLNESSCKLTCTFEQLQSAYGMCKVY